MTHEKELGFAIRNLSRQIKQTIDGEIPKDYIDKMTGTHGYILGFLCDHIDVDIYQRDIEREFSFRRSTATKILQLMEKNQLIYRVSVDNDGRLKKIVLTEKALQMHNQIQEQINHCEKAIVTGLTDEEIDFTINTMKKISNNLTAFSENKNKT